MLDASEVLVVLDQAEGLTGVGMGGGRQVRCLTAQLQVRHHLGYPLDASDHHDLGLLAERFGWRCHRSSSLRRATTGQTAFVGSALRRPCGSGPGRGCDSVSLEQSGRLAAILAQGPGLGVGALLPVRTVEGCVQLLLDDQGRSRPRRPESGRPGTGRGAGLLAH